MIKNGRPYTNENDYIDDALITDKPIDVQQKVCAWIRKKLIPAKEVLGDCTSYGLKHRLENETGEYLTNNEFKDAMMICGFFPEDEDELNWCYYISEESPLFTGVSFKKRLLRKNGFFAYMMKFCDEPETCRGKLANDMCHDAAFPAPCAYLDGLQYLKKAGAGYEYVQTYKQCWLEWNKSRFDGSKVREAKE